MTEPELTAILRALSVLRDAEIYGSPSWWAITADYQIAIELWGQSAKTP